MSGVFVLDDSRFPLLLSILPEVLEPDPLAAHLERYQSCVAARAVPYVSIIDASALRQMPSARARRVIVDFRNQGTERGLAALQRGIAIVTSSLLLRTAAAVVEWAAPLPSPWTTMLTLEEAHAWGEERLRRSTGSSPPPPMR